MSFILVSSRAAHCSFCHLLESWMSVPVFEPLPSAGAVWPADPLVHPQPRTSPSCSGPSLVGAVTEGWIPLLVLSKHQTADWLMLIYVKYCLPFIVLTCQVLTGITQLHNRRCKHYLITLLNFLESKISHDDNDFNLHRLIVVNWIA